MSGLLCILKITPSFSFAFESPSPLVRKEWGGDTGFYGVSFWEQRNAAVVVRVLEEREERKEKRKEKREKKKE